MKELINFHLLVDYGSCLQRVKTVCEGGNAQLHILRNAKLTCGRLYLLFIVVFFLSCSLLQALLLAQCEKCVACFQVKQNQIGQEIICFSNGVHVLGRKLDLGSSSISYSHRHAV